MGLLGDESRRRVSTTEGDPFSMSIGTPDDPRCAKSGKGNED